MISWTFCFVCLFCWLCLSYGIQIDLNAGETNEVPQEFEMLTSPLFEEKSSIVTNVVQPTVVVKNIDISSTDNNIPLTTETHRHHNKHKTESKFSQESRTMTADGDTRCYCNLPVCVSTSYMCKSAHGTCFSQVPDHSDLSKSIHGCLELLARHHNECTSHPNTKARANPVLVCCHEDMCNYIDNLEIRIQVNTKFNDSYTGSYIPQDILRQDVWLKAATIAVPICGVFILVLLVILAVRMLRKDHKRHQKALDVRRQRHLKSHELLLNKSETYYHHHPHDGTAITGITTIPAAVHDPNRAKLNSNANQFIIDKQTNVFHDVNVAIATTESLEKKIDNTINANVNNNSPTSYSTVVLWGKPLDVRAGNLL